MRSFAWDTVVWPNAIKKGVGTPGSRIIYSRKFKIQIINEKNNKFIDTLKYKNILNILQQSSKNRIFEEFFVNSFIYMVRYLFLQCIFFFRVGPYLSFSVVYLLCYEHPLIFPKCVDTIDFLFKKLTIVMWQRKNFYSAGNITGVFYPIILLNLFIFGRDEFRTRYFLQDLADLGR